MVLSSGHHASSWIARLRARRSAAPRQQALALALPEGEDVEAECENDHGHAEEGCGCPQRLDQHAAQRGRGGDADRLAAEHHAAAARALVLAHDVDREPVDRDVLEGGGEVHRKADRPEDGDIAGRGVDQRGDRKGGDHQRLRAEDPGTAAAHGEEAVAVHDEAVDQLQRPRQRGERGDRANLGRARAVDRHPCRNREPEQPDRHALPDVENEQGEQAQGSTAFEHQKPCVARLLLHRCCPGCAGRSPTVRPARRRA